MKHWIDRERDKVVKPFPTIDWRSRRKESDDENSDRSWSDGSVQPVDRSLDRYSPCDNRHTLPHSAAIESLEAVESLVIQSGAGCSLLTARERGRSSLLFTIDRTEVALFPLREAKFIQEFSCAIIIPDFDILLVEQFGVCFAPDYP